MDESGFSEKHGSWKDYYPNGQIQKEENYKNDFLDGLCIWYYEKWSSSKRRKLI